MMIICDINYREILGVCLDWVYFHWNWKYCSEIIFKCVNSVVEPIFNEKVAEKWSLWVPCIDVLKMVEKQNFRLLFMHYTWTVAFVSNYACKKKKKKKKEKEEKCNARFSGKRWIQTDTRWPAYLSDYRTKCVWFKSPRGKRKLYTYIYLD